MNQKQYYNPQNRPSTGSPITINDILSMHNYLTNIKEPSDKILTCIDHLETFIHGFITNLKGGVSQP